MSINTQTNYDDKIITITYPLYELIQIFLFDKAYEALIKFILLRVAANVAQTVSIHSLPKYIQNTVQSKWPNIHSKKLHY